MRVRVAALPPGTLALPTISEGSAAWLRMVPIAYRSFGTGPDLLMIEGQDGTLSWWGSTLLAELAAHYHVTVFDLPGAGYSGPPTGPFSLAWLADTCAGFSLTIGLTDPIVLGWGLGGQVALSLVERHPGFASSLILVDSSAGGPGAVAPSAAVARLLGQPGTTPIALSRVMFPATLSGLQEAVAWEHGLFTGSSDWMTAQAVEAEAALEAAVWKKSSVASHLSQVGIPALVVSGSGDLVFPPANASLLARELLHVTEVSLPGAGYGAIIQDRPAFVAAVERFTGVNGSPAS